MVSFNVLENVKKSARQDFDPKEYQNLLFKRHFFATSKQKEKNYYKGVYYDEASGFVVATNGIQIILRAYESTLPTFQKFNNKLINTYYNTNYNPYNYPNYYTNNNFNYYTDNYHNNKSNNYSQHY